MARPQEYDRAQVLDAAIEVFHRQGYAATSVPDLVEATGLQPGSLYAAFGNKRGVLLEALDCYARRGVEQIDETFAGEQTALGGIRCFLLDVANQCCEDKGRFGCLLVNILLELGAHDTELDAHANNLLQRFENRFRAQLRRARKEGEIDISADINAVASYLSTAMWGLRVMGKTRPSKARVRKVVDLVLVQLK